MPGVSQLIETVIDARYADAFSAVSVFGIIENAVMARYPSAIWRPTPKHGYSNDDSCLGEGIVAHSMEGSLAAAFGELDRVDRQASWHFSIAKDGTVYQHIDTDNISYASGSYAANRRFWSMEHEGVAGEPLEEPQTQASAGVMKWLLDLAGLEPKRPQTENDWP